VQVGDLVKVQPKHYASMLAVVVERYCSSRGVEWVVRPLEHPRSVICSPCDLEVVSANR